jgi:hypothetical protein
MDEMRNRYKMPRREFSAPVQRPAPHHSAQLPETAVNHLPEPITHMFDSLLPVQPVAHHSPAHKARSGRLKKSVIGIVIIVMIAGAIIFAYPKYSKTNPFSDDIQTKAGYSLFYPQKLPTGYTIDKTNITFTNGVVIYNASNSDKQIVFTLQKVPPTFDFATFYQKELPGAQQYKTDYGQVYIGKNGNRYLGSLTTGDTWVLVSTNGTAVSVKDISLAMTHLKKY